MEVSFSFAGAAAEEEEAEEAEAGPAAVEGVRAEASVFNRLAESEAGITDTGVAAALAEVEGEGAASAGASLLRLPSNLSRSACAALRFCSCSAAVRGTCG